MSEVLVLLLESPVMQISLSVFLAVIGLFIVAAVQRRLGKLTAIVLAVLMLTSLSAGTVDGIRRYAEKAGRTKMLQSEKEALTALAAGDMRKAYARAIDSILAQPDRPLSVLTAARAALLTGDLAAADQFYGQLQTLSADDLEDWNMSNNEEEISTWSQLSQLPKDEVKGAAGSFSEQVKQNIDEQTGVLPDIQEASDNYGSVRDLGILLHDAQQTETNATDLTAIDQELNNLMDEPGGEEARDLLIESLVWQQQWDALLSWLINDGAPGLLDLAELVLEGALPDGVLAGALSAGSDFDAVQKLADKLWSTRGAAKGNRGRLHLILGRIYAQLLKDPEKALDIIYQALNTNLHLSAEDLSILRELEALRLMLELLGVELGNNMLNDYLNDSWDGWSGDTGQEDLGPDDRPPEETTTTDEPDELDEPDEPEEPEWPQELSGENIRTDFLTFFNICAPEMTQAGHIRFYVTMAEGSAGFPEGEPEGSDFEFRTDIGSHYSLGVHSMTPAHNIERYTMLLIDRRPTMSEKALALAKTAALAYVRSMPEGEHVLVYKAGLPWQDPNLKFTEPSEKIELFGNMEMETFLFSSDKVRLEACIKADYPGDAFDDPNIYHTISWALNQMTAISERGVSGDWDTFPLTSAIPRFGQVIVFTDGHPGTGLIAGGEKSIEYVRAAAIAANAAVHIVEVGQSQERADLEAIAEAGRGSYLDPSVDSLMAFYNFVRYREVKLFLADCDCSEIGCSWDSFFELQAKHTPTDVVVGFFRGPGKGVDLIGTLHYSDASLSSEDFRDYTFDELDLDDFTGDPFDPGGTEPGDSQDGPTDGPGWYQEITDWQGSDSLRVDGLDRHAIAKGQSGVMLVNLLGQGFAGLSSKNIKITFLGLGTILPAFLSIVNDHEIQFFLPVTMPAGTYSMRVEIGGRVFTFIDTLFVYNADGFTTISLGPWTITASSAEDAGNGNWCLSSAVINDYIHFDGNTLLEGNWQVGNLDQLKLTPSGQAYIVFNQASESFLVKKVFLERQKTSMYLGTWGAFTLTASGEGVPFAKPLTLSTGTVITGISLGLIDFSYDSGTLHPDKVEISFLKINLDLPGQDLLLNYNGLLDFGIEGGASFTVDQNSIDLDLSFEIESDKGLDFMCALSIDEFKFEINTAISKIALDLGVKLIGDKGFKAHLAFKGWLLDEIGLSIEVEIPVTTTPIPVTVAEFGGGVNNMAAVLESGSIEDVLGMEFFGTAEFEVASAAAVLPFLNSLTWLPKIPPLLETKETKLCVTPIPFHLGFSTSLFLFGEIDLAKAELELGHYNFHQSLLGIDAQEVIGLHAILELGPKIDFSIVRLIYRAGPSIDINNKGLFIALNGTAGFGMDLGLAKFTADMDGTFLVAVHKSGDLPQLSIVANIAPTSSIPGLWSAGEPKDIRILVNQNGIRLVGIPSALQALEDGLAWLDDQVEAAKEKTWEAISAGMDTLAGAGETLWNLAESGVDKLKEVTWDQLVDIYAGGGTLYNWFVGGLSAAGDLASDVWHGFTGGVSSAWGYVTS